MKRKLKKSVETPIVVLLLMTLFIAMAVSEAEITKRVITTSKTLLLKWNVVSIKNQLQTCEKEYIKLCPISVFRGSVYCKDGNLYYYNLNTNIECKKGKKEIRSVMSYFVYDIEKKEIVD